MDFGKRCWEYVKVGIAVLLSLFVPVSGLILLRSGKGRMDAIKWTCVLIPVNFICGWGGLLGAICIFPLILWVVVFATSFGGALLTLKEGWDGLKNVEGDEHV